MTTESDRELLELAAKAAGMWGTDFEIEDDSDMPIFDGEKGFRLAWGSRWWSPIADDGDALRLAVKLNIRFAGEWGGKCVALVGVREFAEVSGYDADAATRRAITRAAANIGRGEG